MPWSMPDGIIFVTSGRKKVDSHPHFVKCSSVNLIYNCSNECSEAADQEKKERRAAQEKEKAKEGATSAGILSPS